MAKTKLNQWLNECVIYDIHKHNLDTDILVKILEFPIFRLADFHHSPHEAHAETGITTYSKHNRVLAKFISHNEVKMSSEEFGKINFSLGVPNLEAVNCNGQIVDIIKNGELGGNTVVININTKKDPIYVFAIDRHNKKLKIDSWVMFQKINQIVVKELVSDKNTIITNHSHTEFFYKFQCKSCSISGTTNKHKSKETLYHRVYFDKTQKHFTTKLEDSTDLRNTSPLYAGNEVCPNCHTKNLVWKLEIVKWNK